MPVVHVRSAAEDAARAPAALASITDAVAAAVPCAPESVWCTFDALGVQTIAGSPRPGEGRIAYVDVWIRPRADDPDATTRCLEAACTAAASGLGIPVEDVWGTVRPVEPRRVFAGGSLIDD